MPSQPPPPPRIVVLISGSGTNLQAIIDAIAAHTLHARIALVVSNRKNAYGLVRAQTAQIPTCTVSLPQFKAANRSRVDFDLDVAQKIKQHLRDEAGESRGGGGGGDDEEILIVLAGWMHILSSEFITQFPAGRIINLHPALPGAFDGARAIERAFEAAQEKKITQTGVMVHRVIPEVDAGEVVVQEAVPISDGDTLQALEERIHAVEHRLIVEGVRVMLGQPQKGPAGMTH
ncbi:hypothetical protein HDU87_006185 [Geranomyces variabilis]|uniref:phosphoribosylglycinamide formyltransferase 1 n=1 Tax=Geranomyces variabilis TaxID=109894 RepID=A0AAD5TGK3_9FUNG|nr:hypothetical protein HDU87_006185 [Geranomyces variabilis]